MSIIELERFLAGGRGTARRGAGGATATAAAATAVSRELWPSGEAPVHRAQELDIPFRESLTSMILTIFCFRSQERGQILLLQSRSKMWDCLEPE